VVQVLWASVPIDGRLFAMKRHRHTPEQAVRKLREGERMLNDGKDMG
jgi:hypothetical protein